MICSHCNQNEANTHYKKTVNGKTTELFLCSSCAKELGVIKELEDFTMDSFFGNFLGAGVSSLNSLAGIDRCQNCGSSFNDIVNYGKVGCANCYSKFGDKLHSSIQKIHGKAKHIGKNVTYTQDDATDNQSTVQNQIAQLKQDLTLAIKEQRFEDAAVIRDKIKDLTQGE